MQIKIEARGKDLAEAFLNMARALGEKQVERPGELMLDDEWREIEISGNDLESLLVDFLNEILYLSSINHKVYLEFGVLDFDETICSIKVRMRGAISDGKKILEIKSATYRGIEIKKDGDKWQAGVTFDL